MVSALDLQKQRSSSSYTASKKECNITSIFSETQWKPNVIFVEPKNRLFDTRKVKKIFPNCILCSFSSKSDDYSAMIKALIMSNDPGVVEWKADSVIDENIFIQQGEDVITTIKIHQSLPLTEIFRLKNLIHPIILKYEFSSASEKIANPGKILCKIEIDENGIYSISSAKEEVHIEKWVFSQIDPKVPSNSHLFKNEILRKPALFKFPSKILTNNDKIEVVGIDLGTSRCCAAVNRRSGIETVALENAGGRLLPSYVAYDELQDKCGQIVVDRLRHFPKSTVFDVKRIFGKSINEVEIDSMWPFSITDINNQVLIQVKKVDKESCIKPEQVSTSLLAHIKLKCEQFQGKSLSKVVITIPAVFTESQKEATKNAAKLAGWETIVLLPEPIAASFAYFIDRPIPNQSIILLFDLGGGTLDVCISKIENDQIQIISQNGDSQLGGRDFDKILINYFQNLLISDYGISMKKNKYKLMIECQKLKESLSAVAVACLDVEEFNSTKFGILKMTRLEFEKMTVPLLNRIRSTINAALFNVDFKPSQINKVLLVGGGSRMPMIKKLLKEIFPNSEHCAAVNPDEVVAVGAAYYAYNFFS